MLMNHVGGGKAEICFGADRVKTLVSGCMEEGPLERSYIQTYIYIVDGQSIRV